MDDGDIRISSAEREQALSALAVHHTAGRLDANEYEDRRGRATDAVVRREITELFADLPEPHPRFTAGEVAPRAAGSEPATEPVREPVREPTSASARVARTAVALSPFIATALFFATGRWWWFLLIPVLGVIARNVE